jgi:probable phosphomutase (TIGR03848 family)
MTTLILLRHGHSAANAANLLTGQLPGVGLSPDGKRQAKDLITRISSNRIDYLHVSPIERCQLTIAPWLQSSNANSLTRMEINESFSEIDFGKWSGKKLSTLRRDPLWADVQNCPSTVRFPGGESFKAAQRRAVEGVEDIFAARGDKTHLVVSHSDIIKLITAHFLSAHLDTFQRYQVAPASFTIFRSHRKKISLLTTNNLSSLKEILG